MRHERSVVCSLVIIVWAAGLGCQSVDGQDGAKVGPPVGSLDQPIVGGTLETGYPAVGALLQDGWAFCTGTLIASRWVLTAGHCLKDTAVDGVSFFVGSKAVDATSSSTYDAGAFYVHPDYPADEHADVALVYLAETVTSVTPIAYSTAFLGSGYVGDDVKYVGFGTFSGYTATDAGVKRTTTLPITWIEPGYYQTESTATRGICAGDSGGPGLLSFAGTWKVIGVNSTVASSSGEPCLDGVSTQIRADAYAAWIASTMGGTPPSCTTTPDMCMCGGACLADGSCNNDICKIYSCEQIAGCMDACATDDEKCSRGCYELGTDEAESQYMAIVQCASDHCSDGAAGCLEVSCKAEYLACFPPAACDLAGGDCPAGKACYPGFADTTDCYPSEDKHLGETCMPDASESLSCGDGLVCIDVGGGNRCLHMCTSAADCAAGDECQAPIFESGGDAGVCLCTDADGDGTCKEDDCNDRDENVRPGAAEKCGDGVDNDCDGMVDEGCTEPCTDEDGDGSCAPEDCDDGAKAVHPDAEETCGDGVDNDCDGMVDLDCGSCTDKDGDGSCAPADCNDDDAAVLPGHDESCADGIDNDCDGEIDEGCPGTSETSGKDSGFLGCRTVATAGASQRPLSWSALLVLVALAGTRRSATRPRAPRP